MRPTQRIFKDVETNEPFRLYYNDVTGNFKLISDGSKVHASGTEVNGFYICAHCGVSIKINSKKVIKLNQGYFYNIKEGETITHKKYIGFKRFTKTKEL